MCRKVSKDEEEATINIEVDKMPSLPPPAIQPSAAVLAQIYDINWSVCPFGNCPYLVKVPGSRCYKFYLAQTEEARYLKDILEDPVKFSTFPRRLNGDAIVDCHPEYPTITPQESEDTNSTSTVLKAVFRNFPSRLQERRPFG